MSTDKPIATDGPPKAETLPGDASVPVRRDPRGIALYVLATHGLLIFGILLAILFAVLLPGTFAGIQTVRAILGNNTTVALLAMAEMLVIAGGNYDLSIAYSIGLMHIIAMSLIVWLGVPWPLVVALTILAGGLVGWVNGVLVEYARIDSFIATLGVGTVLYGVGTFITNGTQVVGWFPSSSPRSTTAGCSASPIRRFSWPWWRSAPGSRSSICRSGGTFMPSAPTAARRS
jgi:ribose transport system permease protein